ncbi:hypothetical protein BH11PLA2_BH11PLA2_04700 [soil metagenome]
MKSGLFRSLALFSFALLAMASVAKAQSTWTGATNGLWSNAANWSNGVPLSGTDVTIAGPLNVAGTTLAINFDSANAANSISFTNTAATSITNTTSLANQTLTLGGTGGLATGTGAVFIGSLTANQGVNIALAASQTWNVGTGGLTVFNVISDGGSAFSITKTGAGLLTLNGANTYTGGTDLNGGTVSFTVGGLGTIGAITFTGSSTLRWGAATTTDLSSRLVFSNSVIATLDTGANNVTFASAIGSATSGALTKTGTGTLTLSGANTYIGTTTINSGTLTIGTTGTLNGTTGTALTFTGTSIFNVAEAAGSTQGMGALTLSAGDGTITSTATGATSIATLTFGSLGVRAAGATSNFTLATNTTSTGATPNKIVFTDTTNVPLSASGSSDPGIFFGGTNYGRYDNALFVRAIAYGTDFNAPTALSGSGVATLGSTSAATDTQFTGAVRATTNSGVVSAANTNTLAVTNGTLFAVGQILTGTNIRANSYIVAISGNTLTLANASTINAIGTAVAANTVLTPYNSVTAQTTASVNTLNLSGVGASLTLAAGQTLSINGILRSAGTAAASSVISGGTGIQTVSSGGDLVVRTNLTTDVLTIATPILNNGGSTLTKSGAGTLLLPVANTYTGATFINGGTVHIGNATSLGTNASVLIINSSRINANGGITYGYAIDVGAPLTLQNPAITASSTATFTGVLSGSNSITLPNSGVNAIQGILAFTNSNNTFTGNVILSTANSGDEFFSFNSIGDAGNFTIQKNGNRQGIIYAGASDIVFNTRQIVLGTTLNNVVDGGGVNPVNSFLNNGTGTVTFNSNMGVPTSIGATGTLFFGGTNTGNNLFAGQISNPTTNNLSIGKFGAGKWSLTGANGFDGEALIFEGTLSINSVATSTTDQPLGNNAVVQLGFRSNTTAVLEFIGSSTSTTDKQVRLGNTFAAGTSAGSILNNGTGSLTFTNAAFNPAITGITATRALTLGGTYTGGGNEIQGVIQNNAAAGLVRLVVSGSIWTLSNINTYSSTTTISGGTLIANSSDSIGSGASTNTLIFTGGTLRASGTITSPSTRNVTLTSTGLIDTNSNAVNIAGIMSSTGGLTKSGLGTLTLSAANTFSGATIVSAGILELTNSLALQNSPLDTLNSTMGDSSNGLQTALSALTIGGLTGNKNLADVFVTPAGGYSGVSALTLNVVGTGVASTRTYSGAIADGLSGMTLTKIGSGVQVLNTANSYTGATTISAGGIIVGANDALGTVAGITTVAAGTGLGLSGGINYSTSETIVGSGTGTAANPAGPFTVGQRGFVQSVSGNNTFAGAIQINATGLSRLGTQDGASLTLSGPITMASGTTGVTVLFRVGNTDGDFVTLTNSGNSWDTATQLFTGNAGTGSGVRLGVTNALPIAIPVNTFSGAGAGTTLDLAGFDQEVNGLGNAANGALRITNSHASATSVLTLNTTTADIDFGTAGVILDGATAAIQVVKKGSFSQTLQGANTYTGGTLIQNGSIILTTGNDRLATVGAVTLGDTGTTGKMVLGNATTASNQTLAGLTATGLGGSVVGAHPANNSVLTLNIASSSSFGGTLGGAGTNENNLALTKTGAGTLTLTGPNTYTGPTAVNAGTLLVGVSGVGSLGTTTVTVGGATATATPTLGGTGTIGGTVIISDASGGFAGVLSPGASVGKLTVATSVSVSSGGTYKWEINPSTPTGSATPIAPGGSDAVGQQDLVDVTAGTFTATDLKFDITQLGTVTLVASNYYSFTVATTTGTPTITGTTSILTTNATDFAPFLMTLSTSGGNVYLDLAPNVPEPGSLLALAAVGFGVLIRRRRVMMA